MSRLEYFTVAHNSIYFPTFANARKLKKQKEKIPTAINFNIMKTLLAIIACLVILTNYAFAFMDFNQDFFNEPPEQLFPYKYQGSKDNNGDGKVDEVCYKFGNRELLIKDVNYDGKKDMVSYIEDGVLIKVEHDWDKDGEWDYRYWYKGDKLDRIEKAPK